LKVILTHALKRPTEIGNVEVLHWLFPTEANTHALYSNDLQQLPAYSAVTAIAYL